MTSQWMAEARKGDGESNQDVHGGDSGEGASGSEDEDEGNYSDDGDSNESDLSHDSDDDDEDSDGSVDDENDSEEEGDAERSQNNDDSSPSDLAYIPTQRGARESGEDIYGRTHVPVASTTAVKKYVPPARRRQMELEAAGQAKAAGSRNTEIYKAVRGLLNRLTDSSLGPISDSVVKLFSQYPRVCTLAIVQGSVGVPRRSMKMKLLVRTCRPI